MSRQRLMLTAAMALVVVACGGDDDTADSGATGAEETGAAQNDTSTENGADATADAGDAGDAPTDAGVAGAPPPGQAVVSVDGLELGFTEPGGVGCSIEDDSFSFSFRIGDNEVTLGAGVIRAEDEWMGAIEMVVADPDGEDGPVAYFPDLTGDGASVAVDGSSMSLVAPFMKQPPQDGSNPAPVEVGEGTISVTCA